MKCHLEHFQPGDRVGWEGSSGVRYRGTLTEFTTIAGKQAAVVEILGHNLVPRCMTVALEVLWRLGRRA